MLSGVTKTGFYAREFNEEMRNPITVKTIMKLHTLTFNDHRSYKEEEALRNAVNEAAEEKRVTERCPLFRHPDDLELYDDECEDLYSKHYQRLEEDFTIRTKSSPTKFVICNINGKVVCIDSRDASPDIISEDQKSLLWLKE